VPSQREAFRRALVRWAVETRADAGPLLLFVMNALGHPEGTRPVDVHTARHPHEVASIDGVMARLAHLIDEVGLGEDFLITALVRAVDEHLAQMVVGRDQAVASFRELLRRIDAVLSDPEATRAFITEHGLGEPDLPAMRTHVLEELQRLMEPGWEEARRRQLEVWRRATRRLLDPATRAAWEGERFEEAARKLDQFFKGPPGAVVQPLPPREE
jgi:hypothetical protein